MKRIFLIGILLLSLQESFSCDICGCSSGNYFIGPYPQFHKHFFGIRYSFRSFKSEMATDKTQFSNDFYQTAELWGGMNIRKKWQVLFFVPYNINKQTSDDGVQKSNGLGDISFIINYNLLNKINVDKKGNSISHQLWIGGGMKLPTGKFAADPDDIIPTANNQVGTGSVDYVLNAMYAYHINNWGVSSNVSYKINNSAKNYQFGNRFNSSAYLFHSFRKRGATINPNVGLQYENLQANKLYTAKVDDSGGNALLASAGLEVSFKRIAVGLNAQLPLSQQFSSGQTETRVRGMAHVSFTF